MRQEHEAPQPELAAAAAQHAAAPTKICVHCNEPRPLSDYLRRTGRRAGNGARRGTCRACRKLRQAATLTMPKQSTTATAHSLPLAPTAADQPRLRVKRPLPTPPPRPSGPDASVLVPTRQGIVWMRGRTDKGRRWQQESDLETAVTLVREHAAVVVNRHTVRRLYSNRKFRQYILTRDQYSCFFCGEYGDTIDHLLPRAKGGHTTPINCVCACNLCNQSKADRNLDEFLDTE